MSPALKSTVHGQTGISEATGSAERHSEIPDGKEGVCSASVGSGGLLSLSFLRHSYE